MPKTQSTESKAFSNIYSHIEQIRQKEIKKFSTLEILKNIKILKESQAISNSEYYKLLSILFTIKDDEADVLVRF